MKDKFTLIPADEVPPGNQRKRKGIYDETLSDFIKCSMDIAYIEAESIDESKNIRLGLSRAIKRREMLFDQIGFSVKASQRGNPPRVYLERVTR